MLYNVVAEHDIVVFVKVNSTRQNCIMVELHCRFHCGVRYLNPMLLLPPITNAI